jgi:CubicO group peptidase (beta-lactamase class C family)
MTATLVAILVERGVVKWNTTLGEVFPSGGGFTMNAHFKTVTLDQLMAHRSGLPKAYGSDENAALSDTSVGVVERRAKFTRMLTSKAPREKPSDYEYANANFIIVGAVLEKKTGKSWEDLMKTELFGPLGMKRAGFGPPGSSNGVNQPWGHQDTPQGRKAFHSDNPQGLGPAGTVHASLHDWAKFIRLHLNGSEGSLKLSKASMDHMHTPLSGQTYVSGWITFSGAWTKGTALTHDGSNTMWYCRATVVPGMGFAVLAVCNMDGGDNGKGDEACAELAKVLVDRQRE